VIPILHQTPSKFAGLVLGFCILVLSFILSVVWGSTKISFLSAVQSFIDYDVANNAHVIIQTTRLPRAIIAMLVGANLAIAGALMQALTRNPLASPSIFGINSGAVFFVDSIGLGCLYRGGRSRYKRLFSWLSGQGWPNSSKNCIGWCSDGSIVFFVYPRHAGSG
jgi:ABC-type cobalamin transport system permease subunit